jgi:hypothetical protein
MRSAFVLILLLTLYVRADDRQSLIVQRDKAFNEVARNVFSETEKERLDVIFALRVFPIHPRAAALLFALAQESTISIKTAAMEALADAAGGNSNQEQLFRAIAAYLQNEYANLEKYGEPTIETDRLRAACLYALHEMYERYPIVSHAEFHRFESEEYMLLLTVMGDNYEKDDDTRTLFGEMMFAIRNEDAVKQLLPIMTSLIDQSHEDYGGAMLLTLDSFMVRTWMEKPPEIYKHWLEENRTLMDQLEEKVKASTNPEHKAVRSKILEYLHKVVFPITHGKK